MSDEHRIERVIQRIRDEGGRITAQRLAIIQVVFGDVTHPTIEQVHQRVAERYPSTSIATVYKTVALLKRMGEVSELGLPSRASHYDGLDKAPHAHLTCMCCGRVWDLGIQPGQDAEVEGRARSVGFELISGAVEFRGVCEDCRRARAASNNGHDDPAEFRADKE